MLTQSVTSKNIWDRKTLDLSDSKILNLPVVSECDPEQVMFSKVDKLNSKVHEKQSQNL